MTCLARGGGETLLLAGTETGVHAYMTTVQNRQAVPAANRRPAAGSTARLYTLTGRRAAASDRRAPGTQVTVDNAGTARQVVRGIR